MKKWIMAFAALALIVSMSSCAKEESIEKNGLTPLKFRVSVGKTTRALFKNANEVNSIIGKPITVNVVDGSGNAASVYYSLNGVLTQISTFYLVATGTGTTVQTYLAFADIAADTPTPIYLPTDGSDVYFVAFANSGDENLAGQSYGFSGTGTITGYTNTPQSETLWAYSTSAVNVSSGTIALEFSHLATQLLFAVEERSGGSEDITINSLIVHAPSVADVDGTTFGSFSTIANYTDTDIAWNVNYNSTTKTDYDKNEFASLFLLPSTPLSGSSPDEYATVEVNYTITSGSDTKTDTKTLSFLDFSTPISDWGAGIRYKYIFKPTALPLDKRAWTITISGDQWEWNDTDSEIEPEIATDITPAP